MSASGHAVAEAAGQAMHCLTVAASGMISDYSDVLVRGYLKEHPDEVTYRLDLLAHAIAAVRAQAKAEELKWRREQVHGGWSPPDPALIDAEHHERVAEFAAHSCDCEWCLSPGRTPTVPG